MCASIMHVLHPSLDIDDVSRHVTTTGPSYAKWNVPPMHNGGDDLYYLESIP